MASRRYAADNFKYAACSRFEKEGIGQLALIANIQIVLRFKLCFTETRVRVWVRVRVKVRVRVRVR